MNLADPELELIDPTPNIYNLFTHFDQIFFYTSLVGRALVRWSKRMYSCAGICSYEGRNGLCDIALSEPLLKLRPRKDLVETLLHEMIHAYLFITNRDNDRDGHGPNFQAHMHRINKAAGLNISIYHDFHDEVKVYLKHWWRCNGKCQKMRPYFGVVRRVANRPPGPNDYWWSAHQRICGGTFIKIKEPEKKQKTTKMPVKSKINVDITKYINNNNNISNKNVVKPVTSNITKDKQIVNFNVTKVLPVKNTLKTNELKNRRNSNSVIEKVRDVWKNKQIPKTISPTTVIAKPVKSVDDINLNKHKANDHITSPPKKIKKIDDYFKSTASNLLKDIYGEEFIISQSHNTNKLRAVVKKDSSHNVKSVNLNRDLVCCPSCNSMISNYDINRHLDECLNKEITERLSKENTEIRPTISTTEDKTKLKEIVGNIQRIPSFKSKTADIDETITIEDTIKVSKINELSNATIQQNKNKQASNLIQKDNVKPGPSKESILGEMCPCCGIKLDTPLEKHLDHCLQFFNNNDTIPIEATSETKVIDSEFKIKTEPGTSKESIVQKCPCCDSTVDKPIELHLDECLSFFDNDSTIPQERSSFIETIVIDDDDDEFDESQTLNATGTKSPCPCCLKMVEIEEMNDHLDVCLGS